MRRLFIFAAAAVMLFSCKPEGGGNVIPKPDDGGDQLPENLTNLTVYGKVLDENGQPYPGVVMTDGYNFTETDAEGFYRFEKYRYASFVQCSLPPEAAVSTGGTYKLPDNHYKRLMAPKDMAAPTKRFTISSTGSTSSIGMGLCLKPKKSLRNMGSLWPSTMEVNSLNFL